MAYITETPTFDANVHLLATTDQVLGGALGVSNAQAQALANRSQYLKEHVDALETFKKRYSAVVVIDADTVLTSADYGKLYIVAGSAGVVEITMPAIIAGQEGYGLAIENKSSFAVDINPAGSDTIDGLTTKQLAYSGDSLELIVDESEANFVLKSIVLKTTKYNDQKVLANLTTDSITYVDVTGLTFTTPDDMITRRYILDYSGSFEFLTNTGSNGGNVQILAGATQVAYGENELNLAGADVLTAFKTALTCKCCVDIGPNVVVKVQVKMLVSETSNFLNNVLIIDEK